MGVGTVMQELFCNEYVIDFNATKSAVRAGYSKDSARQIGSRLLEDDDIQIRIGELSANMFSRLHITQDRVLREISRVAFFDPRNMFNDDGSPRSITELDDDTAACIGGIDVVSVGNRDMGVGEILKYKVIDKNSALDKLSKHLSLYAPEKKEVSLTNNVMKVPVSSESEWEEMAEKSQEELIKQNG